MKKQLITSAVLLTLAGCSATLASIKVPENLSSQKLNTLTTSGPFWGMGMDGDFDIDGLYSGKYDRSASKSAYFGDLITSADGSMAAEVINNKTQQRWLLNCSGGGTSLNLGMFSFGGNSPYQCAITSPEKEELGSLILDKPGGLIDIGPTGKVTGSITFKGQSYLIESVHNMEGSFIPVDQPLGYYFKQGAYTVAAVQVNGRVTLQSDGNNMDAYAIATVASALSIRPEE